MARIPRNIKPQVSVCVGAFNEPGLLDRALDSITLQTYRPLRVIVADDLGPNSLREVVESYEQRFPDISWHFERHDVNKGVARNKIWLFSQVGDDFCCFLEHDDEWVYAEFIEDCVKIMLEAADINLCIGNAEFDAGIQNDTRPLMYNNTVPFLQLTQDWQVVPGAKVAEAFLEPISTRSVIMRALRIGNVDPYNASWSSIVFRTAAVRKTGGLVEETLVPLEQEVNLDCYSNEESFSFLFRLLADGPAALTGRAVSLRGLPESAFSRAHDHPGRNCRNNCEVFNLYSCSRFVSQSSPEVSRLLLLRARSIGLGRVNSHVRKFFGTGLESYKIVTVARIRGLWLSILQSLIKIFTRMAAVVSGRWFKIRFIVLWDHVVAVAGGSNSSAATRLLTLASVMILGIPVWVFSFCLRPFVEIRFFPIAASRLGHLVMETDIFISHHLQKNLHIRFLCFVAGESVNSDYLKLLRRKLTILPRIIAGSAYVIQQIAVRASRRHWSVNLKDASSLTPDSKWIEDEFSRPELRELLDSLGVESSRPHVCLWVRESEYGDRVDSTRNQDFASYRNASLENYRDMCLALESFGYTVILMGDLNYAARRIESKFFVDYANSPKRSGRNDLLLTKFCDFAVSGDSGGMALPILYRKPLALVNLGVGALLLGHGGPSSRVVTLKRLVWAKTGLPVTASEIFRRKMHLFNETQQFEEVGVRHEENTRVELRGVAVEMVASIRGESARQTKKSHELSDAVMRMFVQMGAARPKFILPREWLSNNPQFAE